MKEEAEALETYLSCPVSANACPMPSHINNTPAWDLLPKKFPCFLIHRVSGRACTGLGSEPNELPDGFWRPATVLTLQNASDRRVLQSKQALCVVA